MPKTSSSTKTILLIIGVLVVMFSILIINRKMALFYTGLEEIGKGVAHQVLITRAWASSFGGVWVTKDEGSYYKEQNGFYLKTPAMMTVEIAKLVDEVYIIHKDK